MDKCGTRLSEELCKLRRKCYKFIKLRLKKCTKIKTYHIEPHENAANRNPLSDIDIAVGEFKPIVSISTGF